MKELIKYSLLILVSINLFSGCTANRDKAAALKLTPEQKATMGLFEAILANDANAASRSLEEGADPNALDEEGYPAIIRAVQVGNSIIVEKLILKGARIFELRAWDRELTTAFSYLSEDTNPLVAKEIRQEALRLGTEAERLIEQRDFNGARSFFIENKIPADLTMPKNKISALQWLSIKMTAGDDIGLVTGLITNPRTKKETLEEAKSEVNELVSRLKDEKFLDDSLEAYTNTKASHEFSNILDSDSDLMWLTSKLRVLKTYNVAPNLIETTNLVFSNKIRFENLEAALFNEFLEEVLKIEATAPETNHFVGKAIEEFLKRLGGDAKYYSWVISTIRSWKEKGITESADSFDKYARMALESFNPASISFKDLRRLFLALKTFAPKWTTDEESTFSYALGDRFSSDQRIKIISTIYEVTGSAPKRIFSLAIQNGGLSSLRDFIKSKIPYSSEDQKEAVLVAVASASSPGEAIDLLRTLKAEDIGFISPYGIQALKVSFEKSWNGNGFEGAVDFLLKINPSIFTVMEKQERRDLVIDILKNIRERKQDWKVLSTIVKQASFTSSEIYKRDLGINEIDPIKVQTSMLWDVILTGYEVVRASPDDLDEVIAFIKGVIEILPEETASMAVVLKSSGLDQNQNLTHSILPLSILFSLGEEKIRAALTNEEESTVERKRKFHPGLGNFSWKGFVESPLFSYFTQKQTYWESLVRVLSEKRVFGALPNTLTSIDFLSILALSSSLERQPIIAEVFSSVKLELSEEEKSCEFREFSSGPVFQNFERSGAPVRLKTKYWTNLGAFEPLIGLKDKTCNGFGLSNGEVSFAKAIIENNFSPSFVIKRFSATTLDKGIDRTCGQNEGEYSPSLLQGRFSLMGVNSNNGDEEMGTVQIASQETISMDNQCKYFEYDQGVHETAKKHFLDSWYKCAVEKEDQALGSMFESLKDKYSLTPRLPERAINLCTL